MTKSSAVLPGVPLLLIAVVPCVALLTAVIERPAFSNVSLASRFRVLLPESSFTVTLSPTMSATAEMVTLTVAVSVTPPEVTV